MQFLVDRLDRPWGLSFQVSLLSNWLAGELEELSIHTEHYNPDYFPSIQSLVVESDNPWKNLDKETPTIVGPYPATNWARKAKLKNYSVILSSLPWTIYPSKRKRWLGQIPAYSQNNSSLVARGISNAIAAPWRKLRRSWNRSGDRKAVQNAENVFVYDDRMLKPTKDFYEIEPQLINPVAPVGQGKSSDPDNEILAVGPYDSLQNIKRIIDAFYLFVNRLGTQRREDWDGRNPMQMWQSGDFTLKLHGDGDGEEYLKDYAESQQLDDQIEFSDWIPREEYNKKLQSAITVIDVPLAGDASPLVYLGIALGVPAVHTRHHKGLDTFLEDSSLSYKTKSTSSDQMANQILNAVRTPTSKRKPNKALKKALAVKAGAKNFYDSLKT